MIIIYIITIVSCIAVGIFNGIVKLHRPVLTPLTHKFNKGDSITYLVKDHWYNSVERRATEIQGASYLENIGIVYFTTDNNFVYDPSEIVVSVDTEENIIKVFHERRAYKIDGKYDKVN